MGQQAKLHLHSHLVPLRLCSPCLLRADSSQRDCLVLLQRKAQSTAQSQTMP